jgi:hypothetical protein
MQQRPTGITILAVLAALYGAWRFAEGLIVIMGGGILGFAGAGAGVGIAVIIVGVLLAGLGIGAVALAYGFWTLARWAWGVGIAVALIGVALAIAQLVVSTPNLLAGIVDITIPAIILYYLNRPDTRKLFGR